ncbi:metallophosphoesterase [Gottfriedia sp. OAE603]|uniref:metallophosphoesterase n=1 Tax=Gottfriedia sp. OAE603 TaxID=2663872 RepID=UPI0019E47199
MKKFKRNNIILLLIGILISVLFCYYQNNAIELNDTTIQSREVPKQFNNFKMIQLSDLHGKEFGKEQNNLIRKIKNEKPDIILFTGDLIDSKHYVEKYSLILMGKIVKIAPVYFVTGNHEYWSGKYEGLESKLESLGVKVLKNEGVVIERSGGKIQLLGIDDPANISENEYLTEQQRADVNIKKSLISIKHDIEFKVLLSHRPELFSLYSSYDFDVVLTGHAHGGQIRIPFIGGVIAPNQGVLPKYTSGQYKSENTTMIVNRGLGNSIIPQRIFNRPEIVVLTLKSK